MYMYYDFFYCIKEKLCELKVIKHEKIVRLGGLI